MINYYLFSYLICYHIYYHNSYHLKNEEAKENYYV